MEKNIFKDEESMQEYIEQKQEEFQKHYERKSVKKEEKVESKLDKVMINVQKVLACIQTGIILVGGATGVYAISKSKAEGREKPKAFYTERDTFKYEDGELTIPTLNGYTAKIKIK